jgi:hypothetical protein
MNFIFYRKNSCKMLFIKKIYKKDKKIIDRKKTINKLPIYNNIENNKINKNNG